MIYRTHVPCILYIYSRASSSSPFSVPRYFVFYRLLEAHSDTQFFELSVLTFFPLHWNQLWIMTDPTPSRTRSSQCPGAFSYRVCSSPRSLKQIPACAGAPSRSRSIAQYMCPSEHCEASRSIPVKESLVDPCGTRRVPHALCAGSRQYSLRIRILQLQKQIFVPLVPCCALLQGSPVVFSYGVRYRVSNISQTTFSGGY